MNNAPQSKNLPQYELRAQNHGVEDLEMSIWQVPCSATPHVKKAFRVAGLRGRNFSLVENSIFRSLKKIGISVAPIPGTSQVFSVDEDLAMNLGLLFRTLAPMRNAGRMRNAAQSIDLMEKDETAYWLGMAMHRKNPRRVLSALRLLLTAPKE